MEHVAQKLIAGLLRPPRSGGCTKRTKRCDFWNWGGLYARPECCTSHLIELLFFVEDLLSRHGFPHWLDFGSLLGAVRSEEFIPWDSDVDLGIFARDMEAVAALAPEIEAAGHPVDVSDPRVLRIAYSAVNRQNLDLFLWFEDGDMLRTNFYGELDWPGVHNRTDFPRRYLDEPTSVRLYGRQFPAPSPLHDFLVEHRYGPKYMTPIRPIDSGHPDIEFDQLTPTVEKLLDQVAERDRRLAELKTRSRLSQFGAWRSLVDAGLDPEPQRELAERAGADISLEQRTPTVDALLRSLACLDLNIDALTHPTLRGRLARVSRRLRWLADRFDTATRRLR